MQVCAEILAFVRPELTKCSAAIGQQYDRVVQSIKESESLASGSRPFRFIYFNTTNYAVKTSGCTRSKRQEAAAAAKEEKELAKKEKLAAAAAASSSSGGGDGKKSVRGVATRSGFCYIILYYIIIYVCMMTGLFSY